MLKPQNHMAKITKKNSELAELRLSWQIAEYSSEADIGEMSTLHEAGDSIIAIRHLARDGEYSYFRKKEVLYEW